MRMDSLACEVARGACSSVPCWGSLPAGIYYLHNVPATLAVKHTATGIEEAENLCWGSENDTPNYIALACWVLWIKQIQRPQKWALEPRSLSHHLLPTPSNFPCLKFSYLPEGSSSRRLAIALDPLSGIYINQRLTHMAEETKSPHQDPTPGETFHLFFQLFF